jgi:carbon storage regulator CsrA
MLKIVLRDLSNARRRVHFIREELAMLVLSRKLNESICIDDDIEIVIVEVRGKRVRLGFRAPQGVSIQRKERLTAWAAGLDADSEDALPHLEAASFGGK